MGNICITALAPVAGLDISRLLGRCPSKQYVLDPVPTWLVVITECLHSKSDQDCQCLSYYTRTCSCHSYTEETFPRLLSNYRPISNLSFVSKLIERSVASQISTYFSTNDLFPPLQSAYRPRHPTETTNYKITNDVLMAADQGMVTVVSYSIIQQHLIL